MQSALVRKDAVMLHDPMRTHSRATIVGACLAAIACVGFLVWGLLSPSGKLPDQNSIIIGKPSGAVYVYWKDAPQGEVLVPTFNLASARLLMLARSSGGQSGPGSNTDAGGAATEVKGAEIVDDSKLVGVPRDRLTGIQDGPQFLPGGGGERIGANWAVCDSYKLDPSLNNPASENEIETTVLGGVPDLGRELARNEGLLVTEPESKKTYLVYRTPTTANLPNANTVRAEVDMTNGSTKSALKIDGADLSRQITPGLLNAIPAVSPLTAPNIPNRGKSVDNGFVVGDVVEVQRAGTGYDYFAILDGGTQQVKRSTADLIRWAGGKQAEIERIPPEQLPANRNLDVIDDSSFPEDSVEVLTPENLPVACLGWGLVGSGETADQQTKVHVGTALPMPPKEEGKPAPRPVKVSTTGSSGIRIESFVMPAGKAAVVRGSTNPQNFRTGPIYLVSDRGVKYGVQDARTAAALGLADQLPAPDAIMQLLPNGAQLNTTDVLQTYDSVPVKPGEFPPASGANAAPGGGG
ncbi:type VII secretion protein EccB [Actinokineospora sp. G85]|uniref:type VII secretion protein EccB n=1 Tax=Actinokineospora sp. G85 TaxID=3406626 RepID=UPI003C73B891